MFFISIWSHSQFFLMSCYNIYFICFVLNILRCSCISSYWLNKHYYRKKCIFLLIYTSCPSFLFLVSKIPLDSLDLNSGVRSIKSINGEKNNEIHHLPQLSILHQPHNNPGVEELYCSQLDPHGGLPISYLHKNSKE